MRFSYSACGSAFLAATLVCAVAAASPGDTYGVLPRGVATAGTLTAGSDDAGAAYYNPAGLALGAKDGKAKISLGYGAGLPFVNINRQLGDANHLDKYPTQLPSNEGFFEVGALFPLGGKLKDRAGIGITLSHPQGNLARVQMLDPHSPQWIRYNAGVDRLELTAGLGVRLGDKVAVGLGANVLAGLAGMVNFDIDMFGKKVDRRDLDFQLKTTAAPIAGFTVTPTDKMRFSFAYRGALSLSVSQPNTINLGDLGTLLLDVNGVVHYTPHELAAGVMFSPSDNLRVMADLKYQMWNLAPYPAAQVNVKLQGDVAEALGLDKALSFDTKDPPPPFQAVFVPSIATEYTFPDGVTHLRAGYAFRPTYVDDQVTPNSNYLDNTAHILGLGATFQFHDPTEVFSQPLKIDLAAQGQFFQRRTVQKTQGTNDPVGSYDFGGAAIAFAATLRYEFE